MSVIFASQPTVTPAELLQKRILIKSERGANSREVNTREVNRSAADGKNKF